MVRRNKRHSELFPNDAEKLVAELGPLHAFLMMQQRRLVPGTPHYQAIDRLNEAIIATIRAIPGHDPDWMEVKVSDIGASGEPREAGK